MTSSYDPLTTVPEASIQSGLKIKELNKLIADKDIIARKIGGNTLYVDNKSLEDYLAKIREEAVKNEESNIKSYRIALEKAIHKAKVEAFKLNLKTYQKSQTKIKELVKKHYFTESIIEKYCEANADLTKVVNRNGKVYDATVKGNEPTLEFFRTYKSTKEDYETKIDYPLDKSVIADIENELKEKFHIDLLDKEGK